MGGVLACEGACTFDMSGCYTAPQHCGNGTLDPGEECDPPGDCCYRNCTLREEGAFCLDNVFCNGRERCDSSGMCNPGIPVDCDDGVNCTDDLCDLDSDTCVNITDDTVCPDDGIYCNGDEFCDPRFDCRSNHHSPCPCGTACNEETDSCNPLPLIYFRSDFLEEGNPGGWSDSSLKSFEDVWALSLGETVDVDIWLSDLPAALLTGGLFITYDPTQMNITNVVPNDTNNGRQWDAGYTHSFEVTLGQWLLILAEFYCVTPDGSQDVLLAKVTFERVGTGNAEIIINTIPSFDTVVSCEGDNYDCRIFPSLITINDAFEICGCCGDFNLDKDVDGSDAFTFKKDYGRSSFSASSCTDAELCYGDFDCDTDVDGNDAHKFKVDFGRNLLNNPCQGSVTGERYSYP